MDNFQPRFWAGIFSLDHLTYDPDAPTATGGVYNYGNKARLDLQAPIATIENPTSFDAVLRLNDISSWSITHEFNETDGRYVDLVEASKKEGLVMIWEILYGANENREYQSTAGFRTSQTNPITNEDFTFKGASGLLTSASVAVSDRGKLVLTLEGESWGRALEETTHAEGNIKETDIRQSIAKLLEANAEIELEEQGKPTIKEATQAGKWLIKVTNLNPTDSGDRDSYEAETGQHNVLSIVQGFVENAGFYFNDFYPTLRLFRPVKSNITLDTTNILSLNWRKNRPRANVFTINHADSVRNNIYIFSDRASVNRWGVINGNLPSTAPRVEDPALDIGSQKVYEILTLQAGLELIKAANEVDVDLEVANVDGARFGIDWTLGSEIKEINLTSLNSQYNNLLSMNNSTIREVAIKIDDRNNYSFRAGIGTTNALIPSIRSRVDVVEPLRLEQ